MIEFVIKGSPKEIMGQVKKMVEDDEILTFQKRQEEADQRDLCELETNKDFYE